MLKRYKSSLLVIIFFILLSSLFFRKYVFQNLVPFPSNLLVSFYSPWRYEKWEGYPNGPANKPIGFDVLKLFYPYRKYTTERLINKEIPLWNPYIFSGNVHLSTYQSAVFYPLNIVYFLLPLIDAWSLLVFVQPILAGFFTYLFLQSIRLSKRSSLWGAVVFAFSGWMIGWSEESLVIEHSALWLPLALFGIENLYGKNFLNGFLVIFIAFTFSILAGFLQMTIYLGIVTLSWIIYRFFQTGKTRKDALWYFLTSSIMSVLVSSIHLFPAIESYLSSPRGVVKATFLFDAYLMKPIHLISLLAPDFWGNPGSYNYFGQQGFYHEKIIFIGIPALLLVMYTLFNRKLSSNHATFFKISAVFTLALGFFPFGWILYYASLPVISAMVPSRIFFLTTFCFAVVSSIGLENLLGRKIDTKLMKRVLTCTSVLFIFLWIFVIVMKAIDANGSIAKISFRNLIVPSFFATICTIILFVYFMRKIKVNVIYGLLLSVSIISSLYFSQKFLYFSERRFVFPDIPVLAKVRELSGFDRVWGYGNGYTEKNMLSYFNIYSPEGYDALYSQKYGELMYVQETKGQFTDQISRTDATIRLASERDKLYEDPYRSRLLALLGVRYIIESKKGDGKEWLTTEERFPSQYFTLAWEDDSFRIWDYRYVLPRTFLTNEYVIEPDADNTIKQLFNPSFDPRKTIILQNDPYLEPCGQPFSGSADIESYQPEIVRINTTSPCDSLLFLSDVFYKGWKSTVDGKDSKILLADHALRAVAVAKGKHTVEFTYEPLSFKLGSIVTVFSLLGIVPVFLLTKRYV